MVLRSCFPELPRGGCWPRDPGAEYRGCFPGHQLRPAWHSRAPSNNGLLPSGANVLKETAVVRLAAHVLRTGVRGAGRWVARGRNRIRYADATLSSGAGP